MSDYAHAIDVDAPADELFEYLSDVTNLPQYLPTTEHAEPQGEDRVRVRGAARGHPYDSDGYFRVDRQARRMEWGSDGERVYRGKLEVKDAGPRQSTVRVYLTFDMSSAEARRFEQQGGGDRRVAVQQGLERALRAIKQRVEAGPGARLDPTGFDSDRAPARAPGDVRRSAPRGGIRR